VRPPDRPPRSRSIFSTPIEIGLPRRYAPASAFADAKDNPPVGAGRPSGRRPSCRLKSAPPGAARQASAFADASDVPRSAQIDRRPKAFVPIEIGPSRRCTPSVGLRRRKRQSSGRRRPTVGRRPPCRLKSAFQGAARQASAFADAKDNPSAGPGRPRAEGLLRPHSFGAQADRGPKAFVPIKIGLPRRCTPSVGLRRRKRQFSGRRRPTVGRRPPQAEFIRRAGRPSAEGLRAD
jgi:hypothetical protein